MAFRWTCERQLIIYYLLFCKPAVPISCEDCLVSQQELLYVLGSVWISMPSLVWLMSTGLSGKRSRTSTDSVYVRPKIAKPLVRYYRRRTPIARSGRSVASLWACSLEGREFPSYSARLRSRLSRGAMSAITRTGWDRLCDIKSETSRILSRIIVSCRQWVFLGAVDKVRAEFGIAQTTK
ncbi:hypothetical protein C8Q76DRAFT_755185 [Earliella scabrosa]|nr:hypothetical protein C8Q76DRAFT_755185 [Earliella scabrosa]